MFWGSFLKTLTSPKRKTKDVKIPWLSYYTSHSTSSHEFKRSFPLGGFSGFNLGLLISLATLMLSLGCGWGAPPDTHDCFGYLFRPTSPLISRQRSPILWDHTTQKNRRNISGQICADPQSPGQLGLSLRFEDSGG